MNSQVRYYCRLAPCIPPEAMGHPDYRPDAWAVTTFATEEAYGRHLQTGHFLEPGDPRSPAPYTVTRRAWYEQSA